MCAFLVLERWNSGWEFSVTKHLSPRGFLSAPLMRGVPEGKSLLCPQDLRATQFHVGLGEGLETAPGMGDMLNRNTGQWPKRWALWPDGQIFEWVRGHSRPKVFSFPSSLDF